jgi:hypothetical protein
MYRLFQQINFQKILEHIETRISEYELSLTNEAGFKKFRKFYNTNYLSTHYVNSWIKKNCKEEMLKW